MDYERVQNSPNGNQPNWNVAPNRDPRSLGNKIISTPDIITEGPVELGQITPLTPEVQTADLPAPTAPEPTTTPAAFNYSAVTEEKGNISRDTVAEINNLERKLASDGNLSDFYSSIRDMTGAYLDNSFGRKLGESK